MLFTILLVRKMFVNTRFIGVRKHLFINHITPWTVRGMMVHLAVVTQFNNSEVGNKTFDGSVVIICNDVHLRNGACVIIENESHKAVKSQGGTTRVDIFILKSIWMPMIIFCPDTEVNIAPDPREY